MVAVGPDPAAIAEPLLERDGQLVALGELLTDAAAGRGRLLAFDAAPGLGKSALAERAVAMARDAGFLVRWASGRELERGLGWGVARSLFEPLLFTRPAAEQQELLAGPACGAVPLFEAAQADRGSAADVGFGILHGLYWLTARVAEQQPLLLVVDDAHWADEPSLRFVHYLLGRLRDHQVAVLVAMRAGEGGEGGLLDQLRADPAATVGELAALGPGAVEQLVHRRLPEVDERFCRRSFELTQGNPLQVRELVAAVAAAPGSDLDASAERAARSLSHSVLRRLAALPPAAQDLARAVAVFEGGVPLHQAGELAGLDPAAALAAADVLGRADLLARAEPVAFAHPLLRAAVYSALPLRERAATHRRAAALLSAHRAPSEQVGAHLLQAPSTGDPEVVARLREAARQALAHGVPEAALRYLERALREPPAAVDRVDVLVELGRAEFHMGRQAAAEHLEAAIAQVGDGRRRAELHLELARALHDFGRLAEACDAAERGLADLGGGGGDRRTELEAAYLTSAMLLPERAADGHRRVQAILRRAPQARTQPERILASKALIMRLYEGAPRDELVPLARGLWEGGGLLDDHAIQSQAVGHVAGVLSYTDEYGAAEQILSAALDVVRRVGLVVWTAAASQLLARQRLWTGPLPRAVEDARVAFDIFAGGRHMYLPATGYCLARGLVERDEPAGAEAVLDAVERATTPRGGFAAWHAEARGRLAAHRGEHERALDAFLAVGDHLRPLGLVHPAMFHWRSEAGLAAARLGRDDLARRLVGEETELAEACGCPRALGVARRAAGLLERGETAVTLLAEATAHLERCGARLEHVHALVELGAAVRRAGRPVEARATLREAVRSGDALGATAHARRAREELVRAGGRSPRAAGRAHDLTPSEHRVAELAAAGRTNREIANELFVTVKAVEWHLGNAYRKLDIRGRAELPRAMAQA